MVNSISLSVEDQAYAWFWHVSGSLWDLVMVVAQNLFSLQYKNKYVRPLYVYYVKDINIF